MRNMRWTEEQAEALTAGGHVLLTASAGTGKTTTVVGKILWHLGLDVGVRRSDGLPPAPCQDPCELGEIAAITFTEKAAYDLKRKLRKAIESSERSDSLRWEVESASVGTIHAFCGELLREHALRLGIDPAFRVLDEREGRLRQQEIVRDLLLDRVAAGDGAATELVERCRLYGWTNRKGAIDHVQEALRDLRWRESTYQGWSDAEGKLDASRLERVAVEAGAWSSVEEEEASDRAALLGAAAMHALAREARDTWRSWLEAEGARDFDSLILDARRLLLGEAGRAALESVRRRYRVLIIDEFQDTDGAQRDIAFAIAGLRPEDEAGPPSAGAGRAAAAPPDLFLVGDPKQSVYRFRGADVAVWNEVAEAFRERGRHLELSRNFRSDPAVVRFVNRVGEVALSERAAALAPEAPGSVVPYRPLVAARRGLPAAVVEWLALSGDGRKPERREDEAQRVAARILELRGSFAVEDPDDGSSRPCTFRDMAVLARKKDALAAVEAALRDRGVPYYNTGTAGLTARQEVMDLVTVLHLLVNPHDDLRALAFLRSPFIGLRDEVVARIRLDPAFGRTSLLRQAEAFRAALDADQVEAFPAPEGEGVAATEAESLGRGLDALREAMRLVDRTDTADLLETVLERTGYRLHLLLRRGAQEALANLERFLSLLEEYRHLPLGSFLDLWSRWGDQELGIPQAPLYSAADDVVTLSTIHTAKGLEWPVVFLVQLDEGAEQHSGSYVHGYSIDPRLGPAVMPRQNGRGARCERILRRTLLEEHAEEARLLYVAMTRARDRLVLVGPTDAQAGYGGWLATSLGEGAEARGSGGPGLDGRPAGVASRRPRQGERSAATADEVTGTGRQIDAFGFDDDPADGTGQFNLFAPRFADREAGGEASGYGGGSVHGEAVADGRAEPPLVWILRSAPSLQTRLEEPPISLEWMEGLERAEWPPLVRPLAVPPHSFVTSATERMLRDRDRRGWELRYLHGVVPTWRFAPEPSETGRPIPADVRGQLIHGVLERVEEEREIARILEETIHELDAPELELLLDPEASYREALEREIAAVVGGADWRWYVAGPHWRELSFVHLVGLREWRIGAFDLFRSGSGEGADLVVDFKTHEVDAAGAEKVAHDYAVQAETYRAAAAAMRRKARVLMHFTRPNHVVGPELAL